MNTIIVKLIGGLGNQMFQYATARSLAARRGARVALDITGFEHYKLHRYALCYLNVEENLARREDVRWLTGGWLARNVVSRLRGVRKTKRFRIFRERIFQFDPSVLELSGNLYLDGYWQSERYFREHAALLRREFRPKGALTQKSEEVAGLIRSCNSVSLHIRRGDYVSNPSTNRTHGTCDLAYYREAATLIAGRAPSPVFFVFSDDHEWVRASLELPYPTTYVAHNDATRNYEDLHLMSLCRHNIVANSSFSWWGAWLNENEEKTVVAPRRWFRDDRLDDRDVVPAAWTRL